MTSGTAVRGGWGPARRDPGLDALRSLALTLMVAIHYFQRLPSPTNFTDALNFVGEASAPLFFFAFGLTYHRHRQKSPLERRQANLALGWVALAHSLFLWGTVAIVDFLGFLVLWRVLLDTTRRVPGESLLWLAVAAGTLGLAMALPRAGMIEGAFAQVLRGLFPLLPWGVLVLGGVLYARSNPSRRQAWAVGLGSIVLALLLGELGRRTGHTPLSWSKWPLTTPYVLLFGGVSILVIEIVRLGAKRPGSRSRWSSGVELLSRHLLVGAVLQYPPLEAMYWATPKLAWLQPAETDPAGVLFAIGAGSLVCLSLFWGLVPGVVAVWRRIAEASWLRRLRAHSVLVPTLLIASTACLNSEAASQLLGGESLPRPGKPVAALVMIYLALEAQFASRQAPGAGSESSRK